jgi:hypothetical protein
MTKRDGPLAGEKNRKRLKPDETPREIAVRLLRANASHFGSRRSFLRPLRCRHQSRKRIMLDLMRGSFVKSQFLQRSGSLRDVAPFAVWKTSRDAHEHTQPGERPRSRSRNAKTAR